MVLNKALTAACLALLLGMSGCSRQQSDWEKTRAANTTDAYEQFLKKYPTGEFTAQAQARVKELYEEREWQKARDADTQEAYQAFLRQYPEGKWTEEARIRVENFTLAQPPMNGAPAGAAQSAGGRGNAPTGESPATPPTRPPGTPPTAAPAAAPATPSQKPPVAAQGHASRPAAAAAGGTYGIQLGAFKSGADAAKKRWAHLRKEFPKLLSAASPTVTPKKDPAGTLYRLQVVGLTEKHARAVCNALKAKSQPCVLIPPAHRSTSKDVQDGETRQE
jgi:cell division septation protein DedD